MPEHHRKRPGRGWYHRLGMLLVVASFWGAYAYNSGKGAEKSIDDEAAATVMNADDLWRLENLYLASADRLVDARQRTYRLGTTQNPVQRILVLGDSYTYGFGLTTRADAWPAQLERQLHRDGIEVAVTAYAEPGASLFTYKDWLEEIVACRDGTGACSEEAAVVGEFDLVIIGFYANDLYPRAGDSILDEIGREAEPPSREKVSEFEPYATETAKSIVTTAGVPVYWIALPGVGSNTNTRDREVNWAPERWWSLIQESGMIRVESNNSEEALTDNTVDELMANPAEYHPSTILHRAYALDVATVLRGRLVAGAPSTIETPVLQDALPRASVSDEEGVVTVEYSADPDWFCRKVKTTEGGLESAQARLKATGLNVDGLSCDSGSKVTLNGETHRIPYEPCMALGAPHLELTFNPRLRGRLRIVSDEPLFLRRVAVDSRGGRVIGEAETIGAGIEVNLGEATGVVVQRSIDGGCGSGRVPVANALIHLQLVG